MFVSNKRKFRISESAIKKAVGQKIDELKSELERASKQLDEKSAQIEALRRENTKLKSRLGSEHRESFAESVKNSMLGHWSSVSDVSSPSLFDDPVYKGVRLSSDLTRIAAKPIFQRLNWIRQLSFSFLDYRNATHTRLAHTLGVCRNMEKAIQSLFSRACVYTVGENSPPESLRQADFNRTLEKAKAAALVHDIGHGPFGHALDSYVRNKGHSPDKELTRKYIIDFLQSTLESIGLDPNELVRILDPDEKDILAPLDRMISDLLDSHLDVDRMDYLVRDAHMTGLTEGTINIDALILRMALAKQDNSLRLVYEESAIDYITQLLHARDTMYIRCYEHPNKICAERMLVKAVEDLRKTLPSIGINEIMLLTDGQLLSLIAAFVDESSAAHRLANFLQNSQVFKEIVLLENIADENTTSTELEAWTEDVVARRFEVAYVKKPAAWEEQLAAKAGLEPWNVAVVMPARGPLKEPDIDILYHDGKKYQTKRFHEFSDETHTTMKLLEELHRRRGKVRVFVNPDIGKAKENKIVAEAKELLFSKKASMS